MSVRKSKKIYLTKAQVHSIKGHGAKQHTRNGNPSHERHVNHGPEVRSTAWWTSFRNKEKER